MGLSWLVILEGCKWLGRKHQKLIYIRAIGPLIVTIISIAIMNIFKLYRAPSNIQIVGNVPKGLPGYVGNTFFPLIGGAGQTPPPPPSPATRSAEAPLLSNAQMHARLHVFILRQQMCRKSVAAHSPMQQYADICQ